MLALETLDILVNPSYAFTRIERFKHSTLLSLYMFLPQPVAVDIADARSRMNQSS